jgi:hypothetical protein
MAFPSTIHLVSMDAGYGTNDRLLQYTILFSAAERSSQSIQRRLVD